MPAKPPTPEQSAVIGGVQLVVSGGWRSKGNWGLTVSARREAGGWMQMKELYVEGVAAHDGPELCGVAREGGVEALTGETAGWVFPCPRVL